jgi:hypothetical protein
VQQEQKQGFFLMEVVGGFSRLVFNLHGFANNWLSLFVWTDGKRPKT